MKLSNADADADVVLKIKDGIIRNISVGYAIHKWSVEPGADGADEVRRAVDWEPLEISAVPVPADSGAQFRVFDRDDSPEAARARMIARQNEARLSKRWRRATPEEVCRMGRYPAYIPEEFWPLVEESA